MTKTLEGRVAEFVRKVNGEIVVDWEGLVRLRREVLLKGQGPNFTTIFDATLESLKSIGRLTYQRAGSFYLSCGGFNFGPKLSWALDSFSFSRREDAEAYALAFGRYLKQVVDLYEVLEKTDFKLLKRGINIG